MTNAQQNAAPPPPKGGGGNWGKWATWNWLSHKLNKIKVSIDNFGLKIRVLSHNLMSSLQFFISGFMSVK